MVLLWPFCYVAGAAGFEADSWTFHVHWSGAPGGKNVEKTHTILGAVETAVQTQKNMSSFFKRSLRHPVILLMAEILHQLRLVVYPIIYKVLYIPGGAGFLPSTVPLKVWCFGYVFVGL